VRKRRDEIDIEEAENTLYHPTDDLALQLDVEDAIMSLPERERQIVTLHINVGLTFREISTILKIPLGTVLWAYQKAIRVVTGA
jgi:RNA polymerase sigma-70 factor (ECF subfamily)